jgi:hypothetical protein
VEWWRPAAAPGAGTPEAPPKDSVIPFAALLVFTALLFLAPQVFLPGGGRLRIALPVGAFAIVAHCWSRFIAGRPLMRNSREMWLVGLLFGWAVVTLPASGMPEWSEVVLFDYYVKALGVFWLFGNIVTTLGQLRMVAWTFTLTAVPLAATGVWNFLSHRVVDTGIDRIVGYEAPLGTDPNVLAMVLNLILPLTVGLFLATRRPAARALLAALIALEASAIIVTFSRGGFLTLATIFVLYLRTLNKSGEWRWAIAALVLAVAAVPMLPSGYVDRLRTITDINADKTHSAQERMVNTQTAVAFMLSHPLAAVGLGMNPLVVYELEKAHGVPARILWVHNTYLEYAMDLGLFGLGLFLVLLVVCYGYAVRVRNRSAGVPALRELSTLAEAIRISIVACAVSGLFLPVAYHPFFYYVTGLAAAAAAVYETEARTAGQPRTTAGAPALVPARS